MNNLPDKIINDIEVWLKKFPENQRASAILPALTILQNEYGWLSVDNMDLVADYLRVPKIAVYEVASFYTMYDTNPCSKNKVWICTSISCMLRGADKIIEYFKQEHNVSFGETAKDGKFTLKEAECLAACVRAPAMIINKDYVDNVDINDLDKMIRELA